MRSWKLCGLAQMTVAQVFAWRQCGPLEVQASASH